MSANFIMSATIQVQVHLIEREMAAWLKDKVHTTEQDMIHVRKLLTLVNEARTSLQILEVGLADN